MFMLSDKIFETVWYFSFQAANILQITHGTENNMYLELEDLIEQCEIVLDLPVWETF